MDQFFDLTPLPLRELGIALGMGVLTWAGVQVEKRLARGDRRRRRFTDEK